MYKFLNVVFKKKKILFFVSLFFVVFALTVPQVAFAVWYNPFSWIGDAAANVLNAIIAAFLLIPLFLSAIFSDLAGILLQWSISLATSGVSYTNSPGVKVGWPIVRDLANMVIVLGFVIIGIATTLRVREYEAKQLLAKLIIVALLVNFSLLICGIVIDGTNIAMVYFFNKIGNAAFYAANTIDSWNQLGNTFTDSWTVFGPKLISMFIFNCLAFFIYLLYIVLILGRVVALWCLVILSPLAMVCYVFPATKSVWQMWWKNFFQWCIVGIPAGLFYYIASQMISNMIAVPTPTIATDAIFSADTVKVLTGAFSFLLPGLFLVVGFFVSLQFSAMGASTIFNFANKNKGKILGGGLDAFAKANKTAGKYAGKVGDYLQGSNNVIGRGAGWLINNTAVKGANMVGNYRASAAKTRSAFGRALEGAGALPVGTQAGRDDKALADAVKQLVAALRSGNKKDEQGVFDKIHRGDTAAIMAAVSEGKLHEAFKRPDGTVDHSAMNDALVSAEKSGAPKNMRKEAMDKYHQIAGFTDKNVDAALTTLGHKGAIDTELGAKAGTATPAERMAAARKLEDNGTIAKGSISRAEGKAEYMKLKQNWRGMDTEAKANAGIDQLHNDDFEELISDMTGEDIKAFKSLDTTKGSKGAALRDKIKLQRARLRAEAAKATTSTNRKRRFEEVADEMDNL